MRRRLTNEMFVSPRCSQRQDGADDLDADRHAVDRGRHISRTLVADVDLDAVALRQRHDADALDSVHAGQTLAQLAARFVRLLQARRGHVRSVTPRASKTADSGFAEVSPAVVTPPI